MPSHRFPHRGHFRELRVGDRYAGDSGQDRGLEEGGLATMQVISVGSGRPVVPT
ncbi:MAG: hypothetical protein K6E40_12740 [Desulfovibrio sp.]|nr:hypothetical protein [Desulfovibrio sp.]